MTLSPLFLYTHLNQWSGRRDRVDRSTIKADWWAGHPRWPGARVRWWSVHIRSGAKSSSTRYLPPAWWRHTKVIHSQPVFFFLATRSIICLTCSRATSRPISRIRHLWWNQPFPPILYTFFFILSSFSLERNEKKKKKKAASEKYWHNTNEVAPFSLSSLYLKEIPSGSLFFPEVAARARPNRIIISLVISSRRTPICWTDADLGLRFYIWKEYLMILKLNDFFF